MAIHISCGERETPRDLEAKKRGECGKPPFVEDVGGNRHAPLKAGHEGPALLEGPGRVEAAISRPITPCDRERRHPGAWEGGGIPRFLRSSRRQSLAVRPCGAEVPAPVIEKGR